MVPAGGVTGVMSCDRTEECAEKFKPPDPKTLDPKKPPPPDQSAQREACIAHSNECHSKFKAQFLRKLREDHEQSLKQMYLYRGQRIPICSISLLSLVFFFQDWNYFLTGLYLTFPLNNHFCIFVNGIILDVEAKVALVAGPLKKVFLRLP